MSHIYLVISDDEIKKITQERFLKFHSIDSYQSDKYGYYRYDENLCQIIHDDIYCIHNQLIELLGNYSKQSKKLFFAKFLLLNKNNEDDMFNLSLAKIDKFDFIQLETLDNNSHLKLNTIYQIS
ncbi:Uncharacterised protein [Moraxella caprae]|uniref:Uncharacterized protein n=1 Tax=Moraxella caprae TaxID=90240 RepID=A0A378QXS1_9GAMM|nr:hypothetical protein [Moraxella caprae]STZ07853.1 Uncharacterised protein [Moraxella caprae]STZ07858.1 Uncharacterised protein [Moraxella caprae]